MITIYRVQDREGRGPWRPGFSHLWVEARADHENLISWPVQFGFAIVHRARWHLGCGCRTPDQLRRWFTSSEYATLKDFGFRAVAMQADQIIAESDIQLVFDRRRALHLGTDSVELYP